MASSVPPLQQPGDEHQTKNGPLLVLAENASAHALFQPQGTKLGASRQTLLSFPTCCARIEWWIGSTSIIGRRSLRSSSQSALLSSRSLSSRSLDGRYYAGLDRSLNARVDPTNTPRARPCARRTIAATELARIPLTSGNPETRR